MISKEPILHTCFFDDGSPRSITVGVDPHNGRLVEDATNTQNLAMQAGYSRQRLPSGRQARRIRQTQSQTSLYANHRTKCPSAFNTNEDDCKTTNDLLDSLKHSDISGMKTHRELAKTAHGVRILARRLDKATIHLQTNSIMIITKARDNSLVYLTRELAEWLLKQWNHTDVYVDFHLEHSKRFDPDTIISEVEQGDKRLKFWTKDLVVRKPGLFDFIITLGGDGTVLYASTMFQHAVPPILSFALGSLGFLTNFQFENFRSVLTDAVKNGVKTNLRMRFTCRVHDDKGDLICEQQVLNELTVDRGPSPWVTMLELYGDGSLITVAQADGLIIATPTGSTAYSLSAGGSLVHPSVSTICVTPICPHTLSFRPILLPDSMTLKIKVPMRARSHAWASFDGRERVELQKGYYVTISASQYPFPTVRSSKNEYFQSVSSVLNWNKREEQRSFAHFLSDKNKKSYSDYKAAHQKENGCDSDQENCDDSDDTKFEIDYNDESELERNMPDEVKRNLRIEN